MAHVAIYLSAPRYLLSQLCPHLFVLCLQLLVGVLELDECGVGLVEPATAILQIAHQVPPLLLLHVHRAPGKNMSANPSIHGTKQTKTRYSGWSEVVSADLLFLQLFEPQVHGPDLLPHQLGRLLIRRHLQSNPDQSISAFSANHLGPHLPQEGAAGSSG